MATPLRLLKASPALPRVYSRWQRAMVLLFIALQFIAPTWHVCALGGPGSSCEHESQAHRVVASPRHEHDHDKHWAVHSHEAHDSEHGHDHDHAIGKRCTTDGRCCPADKAHPHQSTVAVGPTPASHSHTSCLALLLSAMPAQAAAFAIVPTVAQRDLEWHRDLPAFVVSPFQLRRAARAPPVVSL